MQLLMLVRCMFIDNKPSLYKIGMFKNKVINCIVCTIVALTRLPRKCSASSNSLSVKTKICIGFGELLLKTINNFAYLYFYYDFSNGQTQFF